MSQELPDRFWLPVILPDQVVRFGGKMPFFEKYKDIFDSDLPNMRVYGVYAPTFKTIEEFLSINILDITHRVCRMKIDSIANNDRIMAEVELDPRSPHFPMLFDAFQNQGYQDFNIHPRVMIRHVDDRTVEVEDLIAMDLLKNENAYSYYIG